jgi:dolichyl-phosphate-mannose-protein mannosyltransferase
MHDGLQAGAEHLKSASLFRWEVMSTSPGRLLLLGKILAGTLLLGWAVAYVARPLGQDHGIFEWVGREILHGGLPYRDAWDIKGPLPYFSFALIQGLLGNSPLALRVADLAIIALGVVLLGKLAVRLGTSPLLATFLLLVWYADLDYDDTAQPDGWAMVLLGAALLVLLRARPRPAPKRLLAFGALIGLATLMKPTYALFGILALCVVPDPGRHLAAVVRSASWSALGFFLPLFFATTFFLLRAGLPDLYEVHLVYNARVYAGQSSALTRVAEFTGRVLESPGLMVWLLAAVGGVVTLWRRKREEAALVTAWAFAALAGVVIQGKGFPYHFLPLVPALALLSAVLLSAAVDWPTASLPRWLPRAGAAVLVAVLVAPPLSRIAGATLRWVRAASTAGGLAAYERREYGFFGHAASPLGRIGSYLRQHSALDDRVQVWGMKAVIYGASDRRPPTRFGTSQPMVSGVGSGFPERYRTEFLQQVQTHPPRFIVARRAELCQPGPRRIELECLDAFPEFAQLVEQHYRKVEEVQDFAIWELDKSVASGQGPVR